MSELPEGWARARLEPDGLVEDLQTGFACGAHSRDSADIPHLRPMNVSEDGEIALSDVKFVPASEVDREERLIHSGDVLFNNTNSPELVGKTAYYGEEQRRAFSNHMTRIRVRPKVLDAKFCSMVLHQLWREGHWALNCNNHVSQASISRTVLGETELPLPPLPEQRRIVARVEALLAEVNAARQRLERVPAILKRFRQSVLAAACSGRLTEDWRKSSSKLKSPESLRAMLSDARQQTVGSTARRRQPAQADHSRFEVPEGWLPTSLDEVTTLITSGSRGWAEYYSDTGAVFIRAQDINTDRLVLEDIAHVAPPKGAEGARTKVKREDLLVTITGANVTKAALVTVNLEEAYVSQHVALVRLLSVIFHTGSISGR